MSEAVRTTPDHNDCAREPIHIPGSIQPHGYLFVLNEIDLTVVAASKNAADVLGVPSMELIGRPISAFLDSTTVEPLENILKSRRDGAPLRIRFKQSAPSSEWDGIAHRSNGLTLLELGPRIGADHAEALLAGVRFAIERIRASTSTEAACETLAREIRRLSGFDRVMVYRFDPAWNGEVIAEDKADNANSYLGHSFPASDIPAQARALYTRNTVRIIPDASYTPSPIIPSILPATGNPIDLSAATLRSVSPVHLEYLANMGVAASMSVSILRDGRLWGLAACHHPVPRTLPNPVLQGCELLAQAAAWYLAVQERTANLQCLDIVRDLEAGMTKSADEGQDYRVRLESIAPRLLDVTLSQGLALCDGNSVWSAGDSPADDQIRALAAWLPSAGAEHFATDQLSTVFAPAERYRALASGLAARKLPNGWLIWFRSEWPHTLTWAGDPGDALRARSGQGRINPRKSFASWRHSVKGQSRPWTERDLFAIDEVQLLILRAILVDKTQRLVESELALQAAKTKAEEESQAKSRFLANMSHELRTPLNAILGFSDLMQQDPEGMREKVHEYATYINDSGEHLLSLINDLLDMAKIEAGKYQLNLEHVGPLEIVDEVIRTLSLKMTQKEIVFEAPAHAILPALNADRRALKQILLNLMSNAIKFTPIGGVISMRIEPSERAMRFSVTDNGVGMSEELLARVGQPFEQSDDGYNRRAEGTGLGLALTKTLVELHGGTITFASTVGEGTTVSVAFPLESQSLRSGTA